jgi:hypothetical protein
MSENEFMDLTPKKFNSFMSVYFKIGEETNKSDWERTRLQIYYGLEFKHPIPYKQFCITYMPFSWDIEEASFEITQELIDDVFKKPIETKNVEVTDLSQIKDLI